MPPPQKKYPPNTKMTVFGIFSVFLGVFSWGSHTIDRRCGERRVSQKLDWCFLKLPPRGHGSPRLRASGPFLQVWVHSNGGIINEGYCMRLCTMFFFVLAFLCVFFFRQGPKGLPKRASTKGLSMIKAISENVS